MSRSCPATTEPETAVSVGNSCQCSSQWSTVTMDGTVHAIFSSWKFKVKRTGVQGQRLAWKADTL